VTALDSTFSEVEGWPGSPQAARRFLLARVARCEPVDSFAVDGERYGRSDEPPTLVEPSIIDGTRFRAIRVGDPATLRGVSGFCAFLDGTQDISVVSQAHGIPIVWATASAAIRVRINRRLVAWQKRSPLVSRRYYLPFRYVDGLQPDFARDSRLVDTGGPDADGNIPSRHPAALMEAAVQRVRDERERLERALAEEWCDSEDAAIYIDGSITSSRLTAASSMAAGVIKTHRRLYAEGDAFRVLVGLSAGERSSVFRVDPRGSARSSVASWYLRVRDAARRDALFGLVRVEVSEASASPDRVDEISRWIIAEGTPLSLPDGRWDKMAYGIRDTEEFLRAIS